MTNTRDMAIFGLHMTTELHAIVCDACGNVTRPTRASFGIVDGPFMQIQLCRTCHQEGTKVALLKGAARHEAMAHQMRAMTEEMMDDMTYAEWVKAVGESFLDMEPHFIGEAPNGQIRTRQSQAFDDDPVF